MCNAMTDKDIRAAIAGGAERPKDVYCACGKSAQCGCCTSMILSMIRDETAKAA
ncbi:(2Fe-2S)-binding protein [Sabulicella glaciei]|uniref:Bacterioferritin-associated ferredoxin n=1 Tax=Sabulicella glaciei TaxID=2984948 RepID=A0ABT3NRF8_9PROT|nr:(2Fe-2S)-binding protein [Roseococcus sp. MDT2-1-1]MCW8084748.1 (2Fe-2S)-binding protein [Roseococcus sp. MDT2-1-1]